MAARDPAGLLPPAGPASPAGPAAPEASEDARTDAGPPAHPAGPPEECAALRERLRERTDDLQRLKAEYDNYRKRVRRDHMAVREIAVANVLAGLLPVLDAVDAARRQDAVTGGFRQVADALDEQVAALGLEAFGAEGDPFDPAIHEALDHKSSDREARDREGPDHAAPGRTRREPAGPPVCTAVHRPGYRVGSHLLRPAQVTVGDPGPGAAPARRSDPDHPEDREPAGPR
ncbi:nucleotide exchange factor GrpE [Streptomyces sp. KK5PA1]|uniref:Protein GrpE n=1 Tax=Actinacidiphila acididurans TaxID=2784346 RepID=A0ABS2U719_9ACTN|nr:nucleotide exchange factor GrpE [Actinacidiphila acididurans]